MELNIYLTNKQKCKRYLAYNTTTKPFSQLTINVHFNESRHNNISWFENKLDLTRAFLNNSHNHNNVLNVSLISIKVLNTKTMLVMFYSEKFSLKFNISE